MHSHVQHYNHNKYWEMRKYVVNPESDKSKLIRLYYLFRIKRMDAFNNASFGTHMGFGALFSEPPMLPHGLNGTIITHNAKIGRKCMIFHQVTIAEIDSTSVVIGDNCIIGAGVKIIGRNVRIGNNVKIGANSVVTKNVPDNCTVVGNPARIVNMNDVKEETAL